MSLLQLPNEVVLKIFDAVGNGFFQENAGRLTVSKDWYQLARDMSLEVIELSPPSLHRLVVCDTKKPLTGLRDRLKSIFIDLREYQSIGIDRYHDEHPDECEETEDEEEGRQQLLRFEREMDHDLFYLAAMTKQCPRLRELRVRAMAVEPLNRFDAFSQYISFYPMESLLSVKNLTVLVLDMTTRMVCLTEEDGDMHHICPTIAAMLPTLHVLQVRLPWICSALLKLPELRNEDEGESAGNTKSLEFNANDQGRRHLSLRELVVNLSLRFTEQDETGPETKGHTAMSEWCECVEEGEPSDLHQLIVHQAEEIASRMRNPNRVRVVSTADKHVPYAPVSSLDVVTMQRRKLADDVPWTDDGVLMD